MSWRSSRAGALCDERAGSVRDAQAGPGGVGVSDGQAAQGGDQPAGVVDGATAGDLQTLVGAERAIVIVHDASSQPDLPALDAETFAAGEGVGHPRGADLKRLIGLDETAGIVE